MPKNKINMDITEIVTLIKKRTKENLKVQTNIDWDVFTERVTKNKKILDRIVAMENSSGEPIVMKYDSDRDKFLVVDGSIETPKDRRSLCYDKAALDARKTNKPTNSAVEVAKEMQVELMDETTYLALQDLGNFDLKTSTWLKTPENVRSLGGAIFGDKRFGRTFIYHNGADSYYSARGFRCMIWI